MEEIRAAVQMFHPTTITQAIGLARLQEETIEAIARKSRIPSKPSGNWSPMLSLPVSKMSNSVGARADVRPNTGTTAKSVPNQTNSVPVLNPQFPIKKLSVAEKDARREKGLCFNCDERYVRGHRCQKRQLYLLIGDDEEDEETQESLSTEEGGEMDVLISMHALAGSSHSKSMRMQGKLRGRAITILIDSGSTHNFIEPGIARSSGCLIEPNT